MQAGKDPAHRRRDVRHGRIEAADASAEFHARVAKFTGIFDFVAHGLRQPSARIEAPRAVTVCPQCAACAFSRNELSKVCAKSILAFFTAGSDCEIMRRTFFAAAIEMRPSFEKRPRFFSITVR